MKHTPVNADRTDDEMAQEVRGFVRICKKENTSGEKSRKRKEEEKKTERELSYSFTLPSFLFE